MCPHDTGQSRHDLRGDDGSRQETGEPTREKDAEWIVDRRLSQTVWSP